MQNNSRSDSVHRFFTFGNLCRKMAARNLFLNTPLTFPVSLFGWQLWSMLGASIGAWESLQCSQTRFGGMELGRGSILKMESQFCPWQNSDTILTHQVVNSCVAFIYLFFISTIRDKILTKFWHATLDGSDKATCREFPVSGAPREQGVISTNCGWRMHARALRGRKGRLPASQGAARELH